MNNYILKIFVLLLAATLAAAPEEVEQGILRPIEGAVRALEGIREITSEAREGRGQVLIELVAGQERMKAFQDIDQAVSRIRTFPEDAEKPVVELEALEPDPDFVKIAAITGGENGCKGPHGEAIAATRYEQAVALTEGLSISICDADWFTPLAAMPWLSPTGWPRQSAGRPAS